MKKLNMENIDISSCSNMEANSNILGPLQLHTLNFVVADESNAYAPFLLQVYVCEIFQLVLASASFSSFLLLKLPISQCPYWEDTFRTQQQKLRHPNICCHWLNVLSNEKQIWRLSVNWTDGHLYLLVVNPPLSVKSVFTCPNRCRFVDKGGEKEFIVSCFNISLP